MAPRASDSHGSRISSRGLNIWFCLFWRILLCYNFMAFITAERVSI